MNPIKAITSFMKGSPQNSAAAPATSPASTDALGRHVSALDAAADGSSPTGNTDVPLGHTKPSFWSSTVTPEMIKEAEERRAVIRADNARMRAENLRNAEKAKHEEVEAAERAKKAAFEKANSWEEKMKVYRPADEINYTEPLIREIIQRGGLAESIHSRVSKIQSHLDAWDAAFEARQKTAYSEFKRQLLEDMEENENLLKEGITDLRKLPDEEAFMKQAASNRQLCKAQQQKAADAVNPVLFEIGADLQKAARKLAVELLIAEKEIAFKFGVTYEPSVIVRAMVSAGYGLKQYTEYNFRCSAMVSPRDAMYGILDANKEWR